uniref:CRP-I45 n=1 Tax=Mytilus galloprovincialis TaxID=29158 RepID=A0A0K0NJJ4_MYTGA|nr:CRP-I45 [Mytilus galloprovincialis]
MKISVCILLCLMLAIVGTSIANEETLGNRLLSRERRRAPPPFCLSYGQRCRSASKCCSYRCVYGYCK